MSAFSGLLDKDTDDIDDDDDEMFDASDTLDAPHVQEEEKPKRGRGRPKGSRKDPQPNAEKSAKRGRPTKDKPLESISVQLEVTFKLIADMWAMNDEFCGAIAQAQVPMLAQSWDNWARSNPKVHAFLTQTFSGAGALGVLFAHAPIVLAVVKHHGPSARQQQQGEQIGFVQDEEPIVSENYDNAGAPWVQQQSNGPFG